MTAALLAITATVSVLLGFLGVARILHRDNSELRKRVRVLADKNGNQVPGAARMATPLPLGILQIMEWVVGPPWKQSTVASSRFPISRVMEWILGVVWTQKTAALLVSAGVPLRPGEFLTLRLACASTCALAGLLLLTSPWAMLALTAAGYVAPGACFRWRRRRRRLRFEEQVPYMLQLVVGSLSSGSSLAQSLEEAAQICQPPISKELEIVLREMSLGVAMEEALKSMARRVDSSDFDMVTLACRIQREAGGSLTAVLNKVADTVRMRLQLRGELRTLTAQGRLSTLVVGLLPIAVFIAVMMIAPTYFTPLLKDSFGRSILLGAVVWQGIGTLVIWKIVNVRVKI